MTMNPKMSRRAAAGRSFGEWARLVSATLLVFAGVGVSDSALAAPDSTGGVGPTSVRWMVATPAAPLDGTQWRLTDGEISVAVRDNGTADHAVEPGVVAVADENDAAGALEITMLRPGNWSLVLANAPGDVVLPTEPRRFTVNAEPGAIDLGTTVLAAKPVVSAAPDVDSAPETVDPAADDPASPAPDQAEEPTRSLPSSQESARSFSAAAGELQILTLTKSVAPTSSLANPLVPGEPFTYTIAVGCNQDLNGCVNATITDTLPAALAGFPIASVSVNHTGGSTAPTLTWNGGATQPSLVGPNTTLLVTPKQTLPNGGIGIRVGQGVTITLSLQVPTGLLPTWPSNEKTITNPANADADNSLPVADTADIVVSVKRSIDVDVKKTWVPSTAQLSPNAESTISLSVKNISNVPVTKLVLQEPKNAPGGAPSLAASNPFTIVDFSAFASVVTPAGVTVTTEVYVFDTITNTYVWKTGLPLDTPTLPAGVDAVDVAGIRLTYTGTMAINATASFDVKALQRSTFRGTANPLTATRVDNVTVGTAELGGGPPDGLPPVSKDAKASHSLIPVPVGASITKNIAPASILAGRSATATLTARNTQSNATTMTIGDRNYFVANEITFGGFTTAPVAPIATSPLTGSITWVKFDDTVAVVAFAPGQIPLLPAMWSNVDVSGFDIVWTAATGGGITNVASVVTFTINTAVGMVAANTSRDTLNTATVAVATPAGPASGIATAPLRITAPSLNVGLAKTIRPGANAPVFPGDLVSVTLTPTIAGNGTGIIPTRLSVADTLALGAAPANGGFWNAFDLYAIAPTTVNAGTTLSVTLQTTGAPVVLGPFVGSTTASVTHAQLSAAVPGGTSLITGVEFTYTNPTGFGVGSVQAANLTFQARDQLRNGSGVTAPVGGVSAPPYVNQALAAGEGRLDVPGGPTLTATASANANAAIQRPNGTGVGPCINNCPGAAYGVNKQWQNQAGGLTTGLPAQSVARAWTQLQWRVGGDYANVVLQDHGDITAPGQVIGTVYDAFNLVGLEAIGNRGTIGTNGWYLRWDKITAIEIWNGSAWTAPSLCPLPPSGNFVTVNASGSSASFPGCQLTTGERASTTAVRITLVPNLATRLAAANAGVAAPSPDTGVARSGAMRAFRLQWELRNTLRSAPAVFVTAATGVNTNTPGRVNNVVRLTPAGAGSVEAPAQINIVKSVPAVGITKTAVPSTVSLPTSGTSATDYPTVTFSSVAKSTSAVAASYLRIADPRLCTDTVSCPWPGTAAAAAGNPYAVMPAGGWLTPTGGLASPFETFTITEVTASQTGSQVDLDASTAWLLRYDGVGDPALAGSYTTQSMSVNAFNLLVAAAFTNVVGVSVTFQPTTPANGGTITLASTFKLEIKAQLRTNYRSDPPGPIVLLPNTTMEVVNTAITQLWDPIQNEGTPIFDEADAKVTVAGQTIDVAPSKAISPSSILEVARDTPVAVTLSGNSAASTLPPKSVWLRDDVTSSPDFWAAFELTGRGPITAPAGADRVQIDLYVNGTWVQGVPTLIAVSAFPTLPGATLADAKGIRVTFTKDGGADLATQWNTVIPLTFAVRDSYAFPASGSTTVTNTMSIQSVRTADKPAENSSVKTASAQIALSAGSFEMAVKKESTSTDFPTRLAEVGLARPWTLQFENTGTGALDIASLVDDLGANLVPGNPINLTYATSPGGTLATVGVAHAYVEADNLITFTWPVGGRFMQPREVFTITLDIVLQPGLSTGQNAFNKMDVNTRQSLSRCTNIEPNYVNNPLIGVDFDPTNPTSCGTQNFVQPATSLNLFVEKSVFGSRGTAAASGGACTATTQGLDGQKYFPSPCLSDTRYSTDNTIVDKWLLRTSNTTTSPVTQLVVFDEMPVAGDKLLIGGASRGSDYRPVLTGAPTVRASNGVEFTSTTEVTFDADACQGTWLALIATPGKTPCVETSAGWVTAGVDTVWSRVAGIRVTIVFDPQKPLSMGKSLDVTFETLNLIESTPATDLSKVVSIGQQEAWNQFGIQWQFGDGQYSQRIPSVVGVTPLAGPLEIRKVVDGRAAGFAPGSFDFQVTCTVGRQGAETPTVLGLPDGGKVTISRTEDRSYTPARIDGIPVGSNCSIVETDNGGATSSTVDRGTVTIDEPAGAEGAVPEAQVVTATNTFRFSGGLQVSKQVETEVVRGEFGPFGFSLECSSSIGTEVFFDDESTELTFTIADGETYVVPDDVIPIGSTCTLTEVDSAFADDITFIGADVEDNGVKDNGDGSATVEVGGEVAVVGVVNRFDAGTLTINKTVAGAGSVLYGSGPFTFRAVCTYDTQTLLDDTFDVAPGTPKVVGPYPAGTRCVVTEVGADGANSTTLNPADGVVVIEAGDDGVGNVAVSATNTFDVGSVVVNKVIAGPTDFVGPFTVSLACTRQVNGAAQQVQIPGGAARTLIGPSALAATYSNLPAGANCGLTETATGGASSTSISITTGSGTAQTSGTSVTFVVSPASVTAVTMTITNTFNQGSGLPDTGGSGLPNTGGGGGLPNTGGDIGQLLALASAGLALGMMLLLARRTRRLAP